MKSYNNASKVFASISRAQNIVMSLHVSPDTDSVGSCLAMLHVLKNMGKNVDIYSPDAVPVSDEFLPGAELIREKDIKNVDLESYDLLLCLDAQTINRLTQTTDDLTSNLPLIVIDHHVVFEDKEIEGVIDSDIGSTCELLYLLLKQWDIDITADIATCLLSGIAGDTGMFRHELTVTPQTFIVSSELLHCGVRLGEITFNLYQKIPLESLKFWSRVWENIEIKNLSGVKMVSMVVPFQMYQENIGKATNGMTSKFSNCINDTDFGLILTEETKGEIKGSLRARTNIDVSLLAQKFGGGGHKNAAGFKVLIEGSLSFAQMVEKVHHVIEEALNEQGEK